MMMMMRVEHLSYSHRPARGRNQSVPLDPKAPAARGREEGREEERELEEEVSDEE